MTERGFPLIEGCLKTRRLGHPTLWFASLGSTNDVAQAMAQQGAEDGTLVVADEQTAGRGRLDRTWWAPAGACLLMSLVLRAPLPLERAGQLTMCLGLGTVEAVEQVTGALAGLKWPNDILLNGRKLGGMLSEVRSENGRLRYVVLGLGLNANISAGGPDAFPVDLRESGTSLLLETGRPTNRAELLCALLERTERWYDRVLAGESVHEAWAQRLATIGQAVTVKGIANELIGTASGVTAEGALLVRDRNGAEHVVWSGDVLTLRGA